MSLMEQIRPMGNTVTLEVVDGMDAESRGGFGSTGDR